ncbi:MAG: 23S rRNA (pseudouridine(1915)-N(3))-methyltransferase RlmH [Candidatus Taylorbacteria bacterium]
MKILIITVGRKNNPGLGDEISDFTSRVSHFSDMEWKILPQSDVEKEGAAILNTLNDRDYTVLLDETGKAVDSKGLAAFMQKRLNESTHRLVFIIGGAYGVSTKVREAAHVTLTLSALTFPHQLVRLILIEQIYRAFTILKGEKYHHS